MGQIIMLDLSVHSHKEIRNLKTLSGRVVMLRIDNSWFSTYWYMNGVMVMYEAAGLNRYYVHPSHATTGNLVYLNSFEELFDSLSEDERESIMWNLDLWK